MHDYSQPIAYTLVSAQSSHWCGAPRRDRRLCVMPLTFWLHFKTKAPTIRIFIALFPGDPLWPFWWLPRHRKGTFNSNVSKQLAEPVIPRFTIQLLLDPNFPRLLLYPAPDDVAPTKPLATSYSG